MSTYTALYIAGDPTQPAVLKDGRVIAKCETLGEAQEIADALEERDTLKADLYARSGQLLAQQGLTIGAQMEVKRVEAERDSAIKQRVALAGALLTAINSVECASIDVHTKEELPWYRQAKKALSLLDAPAQPIPDQRKHQHLRERAQAEEDAGATASVGGLVTDLEEVERRRTAAAPQSIGTEHHRYKIGLTNKPDRCERCGKPREHEVHQI